MDAATGPCDRGRRQPIPEEHQMTQLATVVDGYIAMWNETDPERRHSIIEQTWTEDGSYVDPHAEVAGAEAIGALVGAVQEQFPDHRFVLASGPDAHHDRVRFTWQLVAGNGDAVATGLDVAVVADDGRLRAVTGFLEAA
jgi:SnoaL-like domain